MIVHTLLNTAHTLWGCAAANDPGWCLSHPTICEMTENMSSGTLNPAIPIPTHGVVEWVFCGRYHSSAINYLKTLLQNDMLHAGCDIKFIHLNVLQATCCLALRAYPVHRRGRCQISVSSVMNPTGNTFFWRSSIHSVIRKFHWMVSCASSVGEL